jgi:hypothetical protein
MCCMILHRCELGLSDHISQCLGIMEMLAAVELSVIIYRILLTEEPTEFMFCNIVMFWIMEGRCL